MPFPTNDGPKIWLAIRCRGHHFLGAALACLLLMGCSHSENETRGIRVAVEGLVTLDDENLPAGRIVFVCDQGAGEVKATASITNGFYAFNTENGPIAGTARVEIYPEEIELEEFESVRNQRTTSKMSFTKIQIPAKYNTRSILSADVQSDSESNLISFDMTTK